MHDYERLTNLVLAERGRALAALLAPLTERARGELDPALSAVLP